MTQMKTLARSSRDSLLLAIVAMLLACGHATASEKQTAVHVPGTRVSVVVPNGFESAKQFPGFQQVDTGSSVMITEIPTPFGAVRMGMTEEGLASRGITLLSTEQVQIAELDGLLISASQEANGIAFRKWLGVFGTDSATVMVVATFPEAVATKMSEPLKQSVLSAEWKMGSDIGLFDGLTFRIQEPATLKIANRISSMLMLTKGGGPGPVAPNEPFLIVGSSISEVEIDNIEAFAKSRIMQTAKVKDIGDIKGKSVTIGNAPGYEIMAAAKDSNSGIQLVLYQVIIVKGKSYYIVQGLVGASVADKYVPEFRKVASSLSFVE
jgi:hypothetical protein